MTLRKRREVVEEVNALAEELLDNLDEDLSLESARSIIWEEFPELYDEYRAAQPEAPDVVEVQKAAGDETLAEAIAAAVHKKADELAWSRWPEKSVEELRADLWLSPEGSALFDLARSPLGQQPLWQARGSFRKAADDDLAEAWRVFQEWR